MIEASGDGFRQHFRALLYYSDYLKNIIKTLSDSGKFVIPQWDFVIGEGSDILKSLHYYCIGDIFTFFCFLCPRDRMYIYYDFATIMRMFCSGIAFSELCFYKQKNNCFIILAASLIYAFCPLSLSNLGAHVFFLSTVFYFPLIILGIEKIINNDRPYLLSIAVFLSSMSNIYFFYMNVLSTVIFVFVRIVFLKEDLKKRGIIILKITLYSFVGVMMGAIVFLPMFYSMISNTRLNTNTASEMFYSLSYYLNSYTRISFNGYSYYGGFTVLGILSLIGLFFQKRKPTLMVLFLISVLFVLFPFFGKLYNAMVYPTDRWLYAVSLLVAYIIVDVFNDMDTIKNLSVAEIVIASLYYLSCIAVDTENRKIHIMFFVLMLSLLIVLKTCKKTAFSFLLCFGIGFFCIFFDIVYLYSPLFWYRAQGGLEISEIAKIDSEEHSVFDLIGDNSFYRYSGNNLKTNESIQGNHSSTQYYWSVVNDYVVDYRKELGISDNSNHHQSNYDDRFASNALGGVKYYILNNGLVPYGFSYYDRINGYEVYKSDYCLPLIYEYDNYILRNEWDDLNLSEKNETMLQTAVVNEETGLSKCTNLNFENVSLEYIISSHDGITLNDDQILIEKAFSELTITCKSDMTGEYYFLIDGLDSDESAYIGISYKDVFKNLKFKGKKNLHYSDRHDYLMNLGYMEGIDGEITVSFPAEGVFNYSDIKIICQPLADQVAHVKKLNNVDISRLVIDPNLVDVDITTSKEGLLCISIPYSIGWKAYVDGKERKLLNCNIQYMGLIVEQGKHQIELRYSTPLLKEGLYVSMLGFVALLSLFVFNKQNKKEKLESKGLS